MPDLGPRAALVCLVVGRWVPVVVVIGLGWRGAFTYVPQPMPYMMRMHRLCTANSLTEPAPWVAKGLGSDMAARGRPPVFEAEVRGGSRSVCVGLGDITMSTGDFESERCVCCCTSVTQTANRATRAQTGARPFSIG